jgi:hypothetical protein
MAFSFTAASSQYLNTTTSPISDVPMTLALFYVSDNANVVYSLLFVQNTTNNARNGIFRRGLDTPFRPQAVSANSAGVAASVVSTIDGTPNVVQHAAAVFSSSSSRKIYLNGANDAESTTSIATSGLNQISIGARFFNSYGNFLAGNAAEAAIWNAALTDAEVASLAKGFKPTRIRPQSLVFYAPLIRNLQDTRGGLAITNNNSATVAEHPRVY